MIKAILTTVCVTIATAAATVAAAQALSMLPGEWEIVSTTNAADMPGMPPQIAAMMKNRSTTIKHCVTAQEVAEGPQAAMKRNKDCSVTYHAGLGGRFTSEMVCKQGGGTMTASSSGSMTPDSFNSTTKMVMAGPQSMTITSTAVGHRVGSCKS